MQTIRFSLALLFIGAGSLAWLAVIALCIFNAVVNTGPGAIVIAVFSPMFGGIVGGIIAGPGFLLGRD